MMMQFGSSARQAVNAWINPRLAGGGLGLAPVDTESLFDLFDRYNAPTFYAGGGGKGGGDQYAGSTKCCGSGTCDIWS